MSVEEAIKDFKREHYNACARQDIEDPVAYALYQTWKKADDQRRKKELAKYVP